MPGIAGTWLVWLAGLAGIVLLSACSSPLPPPPMPASQPALVRTLSGHTGWVETVDWSPDGRLIASGSADTTARIWEADSGRAIAALNGFRGTVTCVVWSPDSKLLATTSSEPSKTVRIWNRANWQEVRAWTPVGTDGNAAAVGCVDWSPDGRQLAINGGTVAIYDVTSGEQTESLQYPYGGGGTDWSPDGRYIAFGALVPTGGAGSSATFGGKLVVWDLAAKGGTGSDKSTVMLDIGGAAAWSPDSQFIAAAEKDHSIQIWDFAARRIVKALFGHSDIVTSIAWSPDGTMIAASSYDRTVEVWDLVSGKSIATFVHPDIVNSIAWSPDSRFLVSGSSDHNLRIWKVK